MNHVERQVLLAGSRWIQMHEENDYDGTEAIMRPNDPITGIAQAGQVEFQLKATDALKLVDNKKFAPCRVEVSHLNFWAWEAFFPVVLAQYDAKENLAYFLDIRKMDLPGSENAVLWGAASMIGTNWTPFMRKACHWLNSNRGIIECI